MSAITIIYSELEDSVKSAQKVQTEIEGYVGEIRKKIINPSSSLPGNDSNGYVSTATQLAQKKINQLNEKSDRFADFEKSMSRFITKAKDKDSYVSGRIAEIADSVIGERTWYQKIGDWMYNTFCVDFANGNLLTKTFADCYEWISSRYSAGFEIVKDWFKYGDGKYVLKIVTSIAGTVAAIAGAVAAIVSIPVTVGLTLPVVIGCIGAAASCILAAISTVNTVMTVWDNGKALSLSGNIFDGYDGKPGAARYYGNTTKISEFWNKRDMGDEKTNQNFALAGEFVDTLETVATVVDLVSGVASLGIARDYRIKTGPGKFNVNTRVNSGTFFEGWDPSFKNIRKNFLADFGFKISKNDGSMHKKALSLKEGFSKFFAGDYDIKKFTYVGLKGNKWTPPELAVKIFRGAKIITNIEKVTSSAIELDDYFSNLSPTFEEAGKAIEAFTDIIGFSKFGSGFDKYGTNPGKVIGELLSDILSFNSTVTTDGLSGSGGGVRGGY